MNFEWSILKKMEFPIVGGRLTEPWSILTETRSEQLTEGLKNDGNLTGNR